MTPEQITQALVDMERENAALKEQTKTIFSRLDKQDQIIELLRTQTSTIGTLADSQARIEKKVNSVMTDVDELKAKPAKRWEAVIGYALSAVVGGVIAWIMARMGVK